MSLRDEAITHMAQAVWPNDYKMTPMVTTELCESHLDALLDFLDTHTEEWRDSPEPARFHPSNQQIQALVAALRGTTE